MLKRPIQIWSLFLLALAVAFPAMVWLTVDAIRLNRARNDLLLETEIERRAAQQQDLVTAAIWRMDSILTPLVGPEATRPYAFYQPVLALPGADNKVKTDGETLLSPLLSDPSQYVLLHFQIDESEQWTSPQSPIGPLCDVALSCGIPPNRIEQGGERLVELRGCVDYGELRDRLPIEPLRQYSMNDLQIALNDYNGNLESFGQTLQTAVFENSQLSQLRSPWLVDNIGPRQQLSPQQQSASPMQQEDTGAETRGQTPPQQLLDQQARVTVNSYAQDRGGRDWQQRHAAYQSYADTSRNQQTLAISNALVPIGLIQEKLAQWTWIDDELVLARRVEVDGIEKIQGCWIDWPSLKRQLLIDVGDLLSNVDLKPITADATVRPEYALATLPVQLELVGSDVEASFDADEFLRSQKDANSPLRSTLLVAWSCFGFAAVAIAGLLQGVIRLSERRGAFVSAVTHELRTPLTTFRMYAEMLHEDMVSDPRKQKNYLQTLKVEADRLTHLVENVLAYSQLERGTPGKRREQFRIGDLATRISQRLTDRAEQAEMTLSLEVEHDDRDQVVVTDPGAVEQILFNLVENACKYASNPDDSRIHVRFSTEQSRWLVRVSDHGPGIAGPDRRRLFQPFSKSVERAAETAPGVGLGLSLCRRLANELGGSMKLVDAEPGEGAVFVLSLPL